MELAMTDAPSAILRARGLTKRYGTQPVLHGIDLDLAPGRVTVVLGENGAGKTTLMRLLAGDLRPDDGTVHVGGADLHGTPDVARKQMIFTAQHPPLAPLLSLRDHAEALIALRGLDPGRAAHELASLAEVFTLSHAMDRPVRALSGGMAHKAALSLAFLAETPLILLDEPHSGLDVRSALALRGRILARKAAGTAFLLASHLAEATLAVADRAFVLAQGRIALDLGPAELAAYRGDARAFEADVLRAMGVAPLAT